MGSHDAHRTNVERTRDTVIVAEGMRTRGTRLIPRQNANWAFIVSKPTPECSMS